MEEWKWNTMENGQMEGQEGMEGARMEWGG